MKNIVSLNDVKICVFFVKYTLLKCEIGLRNFFSVSLQRVEHTSSSPIGIVVLILHSFLSLSSLDSRLTENAFQNAE